MDNSIKYINLSELIPGEFQPHIEETKASLENLTNSIKNHGIIIPLIVRPKGIQYEIILGNRRYNAARILRIEKVPVIVLDIDDAKAIDLIISDNIQRKELTGKEEGYLYEKALEYPNINTEKLSITLGIPLDRITSKLNLLKREDKKEPPKLFGNQNQVPTNSQPNFINNDIINLADLNQKEKERDEFNMNNNQFVNNEPINTNNQGVNQQTQPSSTEPTFGRRFFPSLEDEPTNMNLNTGLGGINIPNNVSQPSNIVNSNSSSFIDLTDTSHEPSPVSNPTIPNLNTTQDSQINMPNIPGNINTPSLSNEISQQNLNNTQNNVPLSDLNNQNIIPQTNQNLNSQLNQPINNNINLDSAINNQQPLDGSLNQNMNIPLSNLNQEVPNQYSQEQVQSINIPNSMQANPTNNIQPGIDQSLNYNIPPIEQPNKNEQIAMPDLSMPNLNESTSPQNNLDSQNIQINQSSQDQEVEQKNVIPIINMIKDLAINIETLGYKLDITEDDNQNTYKITIEVEK